MEGVTWTKGYGQHSWRQKLECLYIVGAVKTSTVIVLAVVKTFNLLIIIWLYTISVHEHESIMKFVQDRALTWGL